MSRLFTKTGDGGNTSLADGKRVPKTDIRIEANGCIDELNALLGLIRTVVRDDGTSIEADVIRLQECLMTVMSTVAGATADLSYINDATIKMESAMSENSTPFSFVVPGNDRLSALLHVARAKARTCERRLWHACMVTPLPQTVMTFMNRLSDYLFFLSTDKT